MDKSAQFLKDTILSQCEYPPRLTYGKSVWAELFIDEEDDLCIQGFENYFPLFKTSEITSFNVESNHKVYIMAEIGYRPLVVAFAAFDTGIHSINSILYGSFSISASSSREIGDYREDGKLHKTFSHIDPDKEEDCEIAAKILAAWSGKPSSSFLSRIGKKPDISDQVLEIIDEWENRGLITEQGCFQKVSKLMADNGIKSLEDAVNIDIADFYVKKFKLHCPKCN